MAERTTSDKNFLKEHIIVAKIPPMKTPSPKTETLELAQAEATAQAQRIRILKLKTKTSPPVTAPEKKIPLPKKQKGISLKNLKRLAEILVSGEQLAYNYSAKREFGIVGKKAMKELAQYMGMKEFEASFNPSGIAVSGDVYLYGMFDDKIGIHINISEGVMGNKFYYRTIDKLEGRRNEGDNQWAYFYELEDPEKFREKILRFVGKWEEPAMQSEPKLNIEATLANIPITPKNISEFIRENNLRFFTDGGHGWIRVPLELIKKLKIKDKITGYSYMDANYGYLEEDVDLSVFFRAIGIGYSEDEPQAQKDLRRQMWDSLPQTDTSTSGSEIFIRRLPHYEPNELRYGGDIRGLDENNVMFDGREVVGYIKKLDTPEAHALNGQSEEIMRHKFVIRDLPIQKVVRSNPLLSFHSQMKTDIFLHDKPIDRGIAIVIDDKGKLLWGKDQLEQFIASNQPTIPTLISVAQYGKFDKGGSTDISPMFEIGEAVRVMPHRLEDQIESILPIPEKKGAYIYFVKNQPNTAYKAKDLEKTIFGSDNIFQQGGEMNHCEVTRNLQKSGIEIKFPAKPADEIINTLKANGWRFSRFGNLWWVKFSESQFRFAQDLCDDKASLVVRSSAPSGKMQLITQNTLTSQGRVPKNILMDEIRAGKLEVARKKVFNPTYDADDYIPEAKLVWFNPTNDSYLIESIGRANTHWTNAIRLDREGKISFSDWVFRYKSDVQEAKVEKPKFDESTITAQELWFLSITKHIASFARNKYHLEYLHSMDKVNELKQSLLQKGLLEKVGAGTAISPQGRMMLEHFKEKYPDLSSPSSFAYKRFIEAYSGKKETPIASPTQKSASEVEQKALAEGFEKKQEEKVPAYQIIEPLTGATVKTSDDAEAQAQRIRILKLKSGKKEPVEMKQGGSAKNDFVEKVKEMHNEIDEVILKDGTHIDGKDLMQKGGEAIDWVYGFAHDGLKYFTAGEDDGEKPFYNEQEINLLYDGYHIENEYRSQRRTKEEVEGYLQEIKKQHPDAKLIYSHLEETDGGFWRIYAKTKMADGGEMKTGCGCKHTEAQVEQLLSEKGTTLSAAQYDKLWRMIGDDRVDPKIAVNKILGEEMMQRGGEIDTTEYRLNAKLINAFDNYPAGTEILIQSNDGETPQIDRVITGLGSTGKTSYGEEIGSSAYIRSQVFPRGYYIGHLKSDQFELTGGIGETIHWQKVKQQGGNVSSDADLFKKLNLEHKQAWERIEAIEKKLLDKTASCKADILNLWEKELENHFEEEENILFPKIISQFAGGVQGIELQREIARLRNEHDILRQDVNIIANMPAESSTIKNVSRYFCLSLKGHIKRENELFEKISKAIEN